MTARINNPAGLLPEAMTGIQSIIKAAHSAGVPRSAMELVHLRASQINGCSPCVHSGAISAKKAGESDDRLFAVAAWRETDFFTDQERAFDEKQLAGLVLWIATTNLFNRINAATKQPAGAVW
jgi:AhpD family alkylhydroperoxidase